MRINTQFKITLIIFSLALAVIGSSIVFTSEKINVTRMQESLANNIVQASSDLTYLTNDYVLYHGSQQLTQWQARYASFSNDISNLNVDTPEQRALVQDIQVNQKQIKEVFDSTILSLGTSHNKTSDETLSALQISWSRMSIKSQILISDSSQLSELLRAQVDQLNMVNLTLILAIIGTFGVFLAIIYVQTFRRTLKSLSELRAGAAIIGSGNLDFKFKEDKNDEIGELSNAFNHMGKDLKNVTASKADLEKEIEERKKVEEALRQRTDQLQDTQEKLEEYASQMEELALQRANQLKDAERLAAIGATAGMVGHDIRNPLQAITGDLFLAKTELSSTPDSQEKSNTLESLTEIENNIEYINKIVQDLQDYARPLNPKAEEIDLQVLIEKIVTKNGLPKNIDVKVEIDDKANRIWADSNYLNRIMYNLVNNSVQAMPNGGELTIKSYNESKDVVIAVEDTGVGVPEAVKSKLFTPMFTTKSKGQGFGLPVVKRMTESLGGTVSFESQEGKGTTFTIRLPTSIKK